jgi:hypothetical protein
MKANLKFLTTSIFCLFLTTTNSNSMPTVSDIILSPFKAGHESKVDEYKVEITYNLELDGKPLTITKAINCEIFEGRLRSNRDKIKRLTRRAEKTVHQITHKIEETNEVLVLPIPGKCDIDELDVDRVDTEEKPNQKKSFARFPDKWIPTFSIVKFSKENLDQIDRVERVISPKYYESPNARIKPKSYSIRAESEDKPISKDIKVLNPETDSRFYFINGKRSSRDKYPWGNYKEQDKGIYVLFGVFIYPQEIWSKIPKVKEFISRISKENPNQDFFYMAEKDENWKGVGEAIKEMREVTIGEYSGFSDYNKFEEENSLSRAIAYHQNLLEKPKNDWKLVLKKGKEKEWNEIVKKSDYRDYYYPFLEKENIWEIYDGSKGLLVIQKNNGWEKNFKNDNSREFHYAGSFKINNKIFMQDSKTGNMLFYNPTTKELILPADGHGIFLK